MLTVRKGKGAAAEYYRQEQTRAEYFGELGEVRASEEMAERLGLDRNREITATELSRLMDGHRADGARIVGKKHRAGGVHWVDFTLSASKSVSVAMALSTDRDRAILGRAFQESTREAMAYLESRIGFTRLGGQSHAGELAWAAFDHFTSRPTMVNGELVTDPNLHRHHIVSTVVRLTDGTDRVGALDLQGLRGGVVKEIGAVFQAAMSRRLQELGAEVRLGKHGEAVLVAIPEDVVNEFSRRHQEIKTRAGDREGRTEKQRLKLERGIAANGRRAKLGPKDKGQPEYEEYLWRDRAEALGYQHRSVLRRQEPQALGLMRHHAAYVEAARLLEQQFEQKSELPPAKIRETIARGLVQTGGMVDPQADIDAVITRLHERGHVDPATLATRAGVTHSTTVQRPQSGRINPRLDSRYNRGGGHYDEDDSRGRRL